MKQSKTQNNKLKVLHDTPLLCATKPIFLDSLRNGIARVIILGNNLQLKIFLTVMYRTKQDSKPVNKFDEIHLFTFDIFNQNKM